MWMMKMEIDQGTCSCCGPPRPGPLHRCFGHLLTAMEEEKDQLKKKKLSDIYKQRKKEEGNKEGRQKRWEGSKKRRIE